MVPSWQSGQTAGRSKSGMSRVSTCEYTSHKCHSHSSLFSHAVLAQDCCLTMQVFMYNPVFSHQSGFSIRVRRMEGHRARVGTMAWNSHVLSSGSRDKTILQRDIRAPEDFSYKLTGHRSEACCSLTSYTELHLQSCCAHKPPSFAFRALMAKSERCSLAQNNPLDAVNESTMQPGLWSKMVPRRP